MFRINDEVRDGTGKGGVVVSVSDSGEYPVWVRWPNGDTYAYTLDGKFDMYTNRYNKWDIVMITRPHTLPQVGTTLASVLELCHDIGESELSKELLQELVLRAYREGYKHAENDLKGK